MLVTKESPGRKMGKVFRKNYIQKIDFQFQRIKTVKVQKSPQSSTSSKQGAMSKLSFFSQTLNLTDKNTIVNHRKTNIMKIYISAPRRSENVTFKNDIKTVYKPLTQCYEGFNFTCHRE